MKMENELNLNKNIIYDVLIIGGGPAGLNAALYAKRKGLIVGIIAKSLGGQVVDTSSVENYLGITDVSGIGLAEKFKEHINTLNVPFEEFMTIETIKATNNSSIKEIILTNGTIYKSKTIIIATGSSPRKLGVPGEKEYAGKGVAYCAICDGPFYTDEEVIVAGGGNSAVEAAIDLSKIASKVTLVHRSELRADKILVDQLEKLENVEIKLNTQIKEVVGEKFMTGINVLDKNNNTEYNISAAGIFVEIGYIPNSIPFKDVLELNDKGEIIVNKYGETSIKGVYAAGDVTDTPFKQIVISAGEGAKCALSANEYLKKI
jgi:alkyl hydroperoxide reductase subunit F